MSDMYLLNDAEWVLMPVILRSPRNSVGFSRGPFPMSTDKIAGGGSNTSCTPTTFSTCFFNSTTLEGSLRIQAFEWWSPDPSAPVAQCSFAPTLGAMIQCYHGPVSLFKNCDHYTLVIKHGLVENSHIYRWCSYWNPKQFTMIPPPNNHCWSGFWEFSISMCK